MYDIDVWYALYDPVMELARSCDHDWAVALQSRGYKSRMISINSSVIDP